jgi:hypothetical protein
MSLRYVLRLCKYFVILTFYIYKPACVFIIRLVTFSTIVYAYVRDMTYAYDNLVVVVIRFPAESIHDKQTHTCRPAS